MMNLYREDEEQYRRTFGEVMADLKDSIKSAFDSENFIRKFFIVKKVEKAIKNVDSQDTQGLEEIVELMRNYEVVDRQFGRVISVESLANLIDKIEANGNNLLDENTMNYYKREVIIRQEELKKPKEHNGLFHKMIAGLKSAYLSSNMNRLITLRKIRDRIAKTDVNNIEELRDIGNTINGAELLDSRYGKTISQNSLADYLEKVENSGEKILDDYTLNYFKSCKENQVKESDFER